MQFSFFTIAHFPTFINMIFVFIFVLKCLLHNSCDINRHIIKKHEKHTALLEPGREHQNLHVSNLIKMTSPNQNLISTDWVTDFINPLAELLKKGQYLPFLIDTGVVVFSWSMAWSLSNWDIPFISSHWIMTNLHMIRTTLKLIALSETNWGQIISLYINLFFILTKPTLKKWCTFFQAIIIYT